MHPRRGQLSRESERLGITREVHFSDISFRVYRFVREFNVANQTSTTCILRLESTVETSAPPFLGGRERSRPACVRNGQLRFPIATLRTASSVAAMRPILLTLLAVLMFAGCAHTPKSSNQMYEGDGPSIHYTDRQSAGGPMGTTRYR